ncbi:MAG: glutamate racemase [Paludibacteraceae bacterium]|nr:glutamate racemase [Paludibacteraceae bacterium]
MSELQTNKDNSFLKLKLPSSPGPIGIFDSGYGGLTILEKIRQRLPDYDYLYLGDNARTPYGTRSFEIVYKYTLECVVRLFELGAHLVILACNTASAKALRTIQQNDLPKIDPRRRVLGIIRPTVEIVDRLTHNGHVGLLATPGTVQSNSYGLEIQKLFGNAITLSSEACPMWVPLIENFEHNSPGADYFFRKNIHHLLQTDPEIDTVILGCTHYTLLQDKIKSILSPEINIVSQGEIVASSLNDYLNRHPEIDALCTKNASCRFLTTESVEKFSTSATIFLNKPVLAEHIDID